MAQITVRRKPKCSTWEYIFEGASIQGKRQRFSKSGFRTKKEAQEAGALALAEYTNTGTVQRKQTMSFSDLCDSWMLNYVSINLSDSTAYGYDGIIRRYIKPALGKYEVKSITTQRLQETINAIYVKNNFKISYIKSMVNILKGMFEYARKTLKIISESPAVDIQVPKKGPKDTRIHVHEIDTIEKILACCIDLPHKYYAVLIGYYTGMRVSEVYGLTWDCIDFEHETITVNKIVKKQSKDYIQGRNRGVKGKSAAVWYWGDCKTKMSFRTIPVGARVLNELSRYKEWQNKNRKKYGEYYKHHYMQEEKTSSGRTLYRIISKDSTTPAPRLPETFPVFQLDDGSFNGSNMISHLSGTVKKKIGVDFRFHDLRHTHATLLIENGASIKDVQERLGHERIQTTMDTYVSNSPKMSRKTADIFEQTSAIDTDSLVSPDLHRIWKSMVMRCRTPEYRARKISVCVEWTNDYRAFASWGISAGFMPDDILSRYDETKDYSPENCYWFTPNGISRNRHQIDTIEQATLQNAK